MCKGKLWVRGQAHRHTDTQTNRQTDQYHDSVPKGLIGT